MQILDSCSYSYESITFNITFLIISYKSLNLLLMNILNELFLSAIIFHE